MKENTCENRLDIDVTKPSCGGLILSAALLAIACGTWSANADGDRDNRYRQTNLVSDQAGMALLRDTNLVNAWGISAGPTSPFWVSDNGSGLSTLYSVTNDPTGMVHVDKQGLEVMIPGDGNPTGQLFDGAGNFNGDIFIFASEDGTISGWRPSLGSAAEVLIPKSSAVYKGIALVTTSHGPTLLAANFSNGTLDAFDTSLSLVGQFNDSDAPMGYAPFNVQVVANAVFVTFAKQDSAKHDDDKGRGRGLIDIFNPTTNQFRRFVTGSDAGGHLHDINSPWGLALAPGGFGRHGDQLLVGNFGSGTIMSFEADGEFQGLLRDVHNKPLMIDGLWGLRFGNDGKGGLANTLYFTAGPNDEADGLFGSLEPIEQGHRHHDRD